MAHRESIQIRAHRFLLLLILVLALFIPLQAAADKGSAEEIVVGIPENFPPRYFIDKRTEEPSGFAVEFIERIASQAGYQIKLTVFKTWLKLDLALNEGLIDVVPNYGITPEREERYHFTAPYDIFLIQIFARSSDDTIKGLDDLSGLPVAVVAINKGQKIMEEYGESDLKVYGSPEEALMSLLSGNTDALVYPGQTMIRTAERSGLSRRIKTVDEPLFEVKRGLAVARGRPELFANLDRHVKLFIKTDEFRELFKKWFREPSPYWNVYRVAALMGALLLGTVTCLIFWRFRSVMIVNRKLRESEKRYYVLAEVSPVGIFHTDTAGNYQYVNERWCEITGMTPEEAEGEGWARSLHYEDRERIFKEWYAAARERLPFQSEYRFKTPDGTVKWVFGQARADRDKNGRIVGYVGTITEITERKRLETQLQQSQKMEAIGTLAGGIAHDFNNILLAILGYTDMARMRAEKDSALSSNLDQVLKAGNRAKALVNQILSFSRQTDYEMRPVEIQNIIKEALNLLRASIPSSIEIRENVAQAAGFVMADPAQIHQILMNLCTNAYHAMLDSGGILDVSLQEVEINAKDTIRRLEIEPGSYVRITVSDTGCGMDSDTMNRIFEPYFTTKDDNGGTGLGLSVVHGIVKSHRGHVTVYSEPGKGTTFHIYFPLTERLKDMEDETKTDIIYRGNEHLLIVDDERQITEMLREMLEDLGYQVTAHTDSMRALEEFRLRPEEFDIVITDMTMPGIDGAKLAKQILHMRPDIKIILLMGFSEQITEEKARNIGIRRFIMKPILRADLSKTIRETLDEQV